MFKLALRETEYEPSGTSVNGGFSKKKKKVALSIFQASSILLDLQLIVAPTPACSVDVEEEGRENL